jgi:hypothetical protein
MRVRLAESSIIASVEVQKHCNVCTSVPGKKKQMAEGQ